MGANSRSSTYSYHWGIHIVVLMLRLKALNLGRVGFSSMTYNRDMSRDLSHM